mgnify:CR=1 FL=1
MKKLILTLISILLLTSAYAGMSDENKERVIKCAGIYYSNSMIPQGELELEKIVHSFAAKKFLSTYLVSEGVNEDNLNKELIKVVDERYGKPYDENITKECDGFIYKLIPNSKSEIDKLVKSGIY